MKRNHCMGAFAGLCVMSSATRAADLGTAFTYQGSLENGSGPVTDTCDFRFGLWDSAAGGSQVGSSPQAVVGVVVENGVFTTPIDFGASAINGTARWLAIEVKCTGDADFVALDSQRVKLTPVPHALALPGLYTQQNATSPNIIGGYSGNTVTAGAIGATIGGGGSSGFINSVTSDIGTVSGGAGNQASAGATVGGGSSNRATGEGATVAGGILNTASGSYVATVGGGYANEATRERSTIGGGFYNSAAGYGSTIGGGDSNYVLGGYGTIAGGGPTDPSNPATSATTNNRVYDGYGTICGGGGNRAGSDDGDVVTAEYATVGGGHSNTATANYSTVGGGVNNSASNRWSTICGGGGNEAQGESSTIAGGGSNRTTGDHGAIGGGDSNIADVYATVAGGFNNSATLGQGSIGGGANNVAGYFATVAGGEGNNANGGHAAVPGGSSNVAGGNYSFAAGRRAKVRTPAQIGGGDLDGDQGSFVWADSTNNDFASTGPNQFLVRASGGVGIGTAAPTAKLHVDTPGGGGIHISSNNVGDIRYSLNNGGGTHYIFDDQSNANALKIETAPGRDLAFNTNGANERMRIGSAGRVGIGRTAAVNMLEVAGNDASKGVAGSWLANSDRRIKKNIETIQSALDTLDNVRLVSFEYTDQYRAEHNSIPARRYINVIAQEFARVFPDFVKSSGETIPGTDEEILQVDSYPLTVYAAAAVQELHKIVQEKDCEIENLKSEISDFKSEVSKISELKSEISELKALVRNLAENNGGGQ